MMAVDPGLDTGWARFDGDGALLACGVCSPQSLPHAGPLERVAIEWPIERKWGRRAGGASLVELAAHAGMALVSCGASLVDKYAPHEWKGSIPKPDSGLLGDYIVFKRAWAALDAREREVVMVAAAPLLRRQALDLIDAVGLGLVATGRLARGLK